MKKSFKLVAGTLLFSSALIFAQEPTIHAATQATPPTTQALYPQALVESDSVKAARTAVEQAMTNLKTQIKTVAETAKAADQATQTVRSIQKEIQDKQVVITDNQSEYQEQVAQVAELTKFAKTVDQAQLARDRDQVKKMEDSVEASRSARDAEKDAAKRQQLNAKFVKDFSQLSALKDSVQHREEAKQDLAAGQSSLADSKAEGQNLQGQWGLLQDKLTHAKQTATTTQQQHDTATEHAKVAQTDLDQKTAHLSELLKNNGVVNSGTTNDSAPAPTATADSHGNHQVDDNDADSDADTDEADVPTTTPATKSATHDTDTVHHADSKPQLPQTNEQTPGFLGLLGGLLLILTAAGTSVMMKKRRSN